MIEVSAKIKYPLTHAGNTGCVKALIAIRVHRNLSAAAVTASLPLRPQVNIPIRVIVMLHSAACAGPAKVFRVKAALDYSLLFSVTH